MTYTHRSPPSAQRGIMLLIVLIAVVLLSLAGAAMMRAADTAGVVIGNIGFRQGAISVSDLGVEEARIWLAAQWDSGNPGVASMTTTAAGACSPGAVAGNPTWCLWYNQITNSNVAWYIASTADSFDPRIYAWSDATAKRVAAGVPAGYVVHWVIHRMCENVAGGDPSIAGSLCLKQSGTAAAGDSQRAAAYGQAVKRTFNSGPYYRVTVRVTGPRSTTSYIQAIVF